MSKRPESLPTATVPVTLLGTPTSADALCERHFEPPLRLPVPSRSASSRRAAGARGRPLPPPDGDDR
jgi:hypothetical protein